MSVKLIHGDCIEKMKDLSDNSIDIVIADLPYGRFKHLQWDKCINLDKLWKQIWRVCKEKAPVFMFGDMKFGVELINSCPRLFKYEIVWNKNKSTTPFLSKKRLGKATEYIFIFYKKQPVYNYLKYHTIKKREKIYFNGSFVGAKRIKKQTNYYVPTLPINVFTQSQPRHNKLIKNITEKPQFILEFLLKYFSNEGDTCLDMTIGSGSCGVACQSLKRNFVGIELNKKYFEIAKKRLDS